MKILWNRNEKEPVFTVEFDCGHKAEATAFSKLPTICSICWEEAMENLREAEREAEARRLALRDLIRRGELDAQLNNSNGPQLFCKWCGGMQ